MSARPPALDFSLVNFAYGRFNMPTLMLGMNQQAPTIFVAGKIYQSLMTYTKDLKPQPELAKSWAMSADGLTYTYTLRDGLKWSDGQPFSAEINLPPLGALWLVPDADSLRAEAEARLAQKPRIEGGQQQPSASAAFSRVLDAAADEAKRMEDEYVSTEHLLLALDVVPRDALEVAGLLAIELHDGRDMLDRLLLGGEDRLVEYLGRLAALGFAKKHGDSLYMCYVETDDVPAIIGWGNRIFTFTTYLYLLLNPQDALPRYGLAAALSTVAMVIAEFFTSISGLGAIIITSANNFDTATTFVPIIIIMFMAVTLNFTIGAIERWVAPWQAEIAGRGVTGAEGDKIAMRGNVVEAQMLEAGAVYALERAQHLLHAIRKALIGRDRVAIERVAAAVRRTGLQRKPLVDDQRLVLEQLVKAG